MIASPSDTTEARDAVEQAIAGWNASNAHKGVILMPWRWETASVPVVGDHPQSLINAQGVDDSDIVFALFGSRLGSPTPAAVSGTVEEIERAVAQGKPVHLYFSTAPLPNDVDTEQLEGLRAFKAEISQRSLLGEFSSASELNHQVWQAIEHDLTALNLDSPGPKSTPSAVAFNVQPQQEREHTGFSKANRAQYKTRHWLDVTNTSETDATDVRFESLGESGLHIFPDGQATVIHAKQTRRVPVTHLMGGSDPAIIRIHWRDANGTEQSKDFHVG